MLRLREIMTRDVVTVGPEATLREAMELLATRHLGGAPVVRGGTVVGIVTSNDLMGLAAALPGVPRQRDAVPDDEPLDDAPPRVDDDAPAAWFTDMWDDAGAEVVERLAQSEGPEWNSLEEHTVEEAMTREPVETLPSSARVDEAADLMRRRGIHRLLVVDDGALVGIVTTTDVVRAVAEGKVVRERFVFG
jgi:CBS domain-containing protein